MGVSRVLLMDFSISSRRNVSAFRVTFFEMLSAWSPSFLADMTRISREMNHRACKERGQSSLLPMRLRLLPSHSFRHSKFTLANRIVGSEEARVKRWPPSAAQTARTVFPYAAFTKTQRRQ